MSILAEGKTGVEGRSREVSLAAATPKTTIILSTPIQTSINGCHSSNTKDSETEESREQTRINVDGNNERHRQRYIYILRQRPHRRLRFVNAKE